MLGRLFFPFLWSVSAHEHLRPRRPRNACRHRGGGGFERAAQRLNVTQSAVSQRLRALEARYSVLIVRSRPLKPTSAGQLLLSTRKQLRLLRADLERDLQELAPAPGGSREDERISIAINADSIATWAMGALHDLVRQRLPLEIITDDQDFTQEWLRSGQVLGCVTRSSRRCAAARWCRWAPCTMWRWPRPTLPASTCPRG